MIRKAERIIVPAMLAALVLTAPAISLAATAEENFQWYCAQCHGEKGAGNGVNSTVKELPVGPMNLSKAKEIKKYSNEDIVNTVTHGGPVNRLESLMPPWGNRLSQDEIKALMQFVRTLCKEADCPK